VEVLKLLLYNTTRGVAASQRPLEALRILPDVAWDDLFVARRSMDELKRLFHEALPLVEAEVAAAEMPLLAPIGTQEVWAAGVTYLRSRTARMEESATSGGSQFYDKVYHSQRPELFFKATPHRVVGHGGAMTLRRDSNWLVPEPELALAFNHRGELVGYTVANDLSSRDIEGENPLYLPQAKVFDRCAALGPGLLLADIYPPASTAIQISIRRGGTDVFRGETSIAQMKQTFDNLREYLFRHNSFPNGCYLMTGTGIVPADDFSLKPGDEVAITIPEVGTLVTVME
jgi:2-dehydro-3-deoxy-D-arabinonate dehydratase